MPAPILGPPQIPPAVLRVVRAAMAAGALLFGGVALWHSTHAPVRTDGGPNPALAMVAYGFCAFTVAGVYGIRALRSRMQPANRPQLSVMGWAVAEAAALLGGVIMMLGGPPWPWVLGMLVIALSWVQIPVDPAED
jgi:FtsH-binding integral membrane protein